MNADPILIEAATRLFADAANDDAAGAAEAGAWPQGLWQAIDEFGLPRALVDEGSGGLGLPLSEGCALLACAGAFAAPGPIAETMIANWLVSRAGLEPEVGPATIALGDVRLASGRLTGRAARVPWGRSAAVIAVVEQDGRAVLARIGRDGVEAAPGENIAHEPRDELAIDSTAAVVHALPDGLGRAEVLAVLAAARCAAMSGAMSRIAEMTLGYAQGRRQFGRPISQFQSIQHQLAVLVEHTAAAAAAAELAAEAVSALPIRRLAVAAAKLRVGEAAGAIAAIAHQVHGAMGFTLEYPLHRLTRRLWAWREEYGAETYWAAELGRAMAAAGPGGLWPAITDL